MIEQFTDEQRSSCVPKEINWELEQVCLDVDSYEELCANDDKLPDTLVDYDSYETIIEDIMVEDFINSLNDNEKHIVNELLNGMTHQEISDTMDCTRQSVSRCIERIGAKAIDFLSYK